MKCTWSGAWRLAFALLLHALLLAPAAETLGQATPEPAARSFVWDQVDVTVELREDGALHVTERGRVDFTGGPFQVGFREIPLARIERVDNVRVGALDGEYIRPYRFVAPEQFTRDAPNTYTFRDDGAMLGIDLSFPPLTSASYAYQIEFDAFGALGVHADAAPPYQEIAWIGVDDVLTGTAPVNEASLSFVLPRPIDPGAAIVQGPGGARPRDHTDDGRTWVWRASGLGPGDALTASLRFPPLVDAEAPAWQEESGRAGTATPIAQATPMAASPDLPLCREVIESDFPGQRRELLADCITERPIFVPENWVFAGGGHVIYARDPAGGLLTGGIIEATAGGSVIQDAIVDGSLLTAPCQDDDGAMFVAGVVFRSAPGTVSGVTVRDMRRELAPGVDAGSPSIRLRKSCGMGVVAMGGSGPVEISETAIADVAYAGIVVDSAQVSISHTLIERAGTFGIQVHNGQVRISPGNQIRDGLIGIQIEGGGGGRVAGTTIEGMTKSGIEVIGARATIADSRIADVGETGILMHGASGAIQANSIDEASYGIAASGGGEIEIIGNSVRRPADSGIFVTDSGTEVTIADNSIEGSALDGVWVQQGALADVRDNRVTGSARNGVAAIGADTRVTIEGNNVAESGTHGIWVGASSADITGNEVTDAAENGILLSGGARAAIEANRVSGGQRGIEAGGAGTTATVTNNTVSGVGSPGISINGGATAPDVSGNMVTGSRFGIVVLGAGTTATVADNTVSDLGGSGFTVESGAAATLYGNHVSRSPWGIAVTGAGTAAELRENRIEGTDTVGIAVDEGARATVVGNTLLQPGMNGIEIDGAGHVVLEANTIEDARSNGIRFHRPQAGTAADAMEPDVLRDNEIRGGASGIALTGSGANVSVAANRIEGLSGTGIAVSAGAAAVIEDNMVAAAGMGIEVAEVGTTASLMGNRVTDAAERGILIQGGAEATVDQNTVLRAGTSGIGIDGEGTTASLTATIVTDAAESGIIVERGATATITEGNVVSGGTWGISILSEGTAGEVRGNEILGAANQGIAVVYGAHADIADNAIQGDSGIYVRFAGSSAVITGNTITADRQGILVWEEGSAERIADNDVSGASIGIRIEGEGAQATIVGNRVSDFGSEGIAVRDGAAADVIGNRVQGTREERRFVPYDVWGIIVSGEGAAATVADNELSDISGVGIQIDQGGAGTVRDNAVRATDGWGIRLIEAAPGVVVSENTLEDAGTVGIQLGIGVEATVVDNTIVGPPAPDASRLGPFGVRIQRDASGAVVDNRISGFRNGGDACAIRLELGVGDVRVTDNAFPPPGNDRDVCDDRLPASATTATAAPLLAPTPCRVPADLGPNVAVVATRTTILQRSPTDARPPRPIIARGTRLLIAPSVTEIGSDAAGEACRWLPVVDVATGQPGYIPADHVELDDATTDSAP